MRHRTNLASLSAATVLLATGAGAAEDAAGGASSQTLEEIVVTANKREQSARDVAGSLTALSADAIEERGIRGMKDYLASLPSVAFQDRGVARNKIVIRGVTSGLDAAEEPTTGVYIGETPVSGIGQNGSFDLKLADVERVEVLRGPQGTLYGAGSMGGALKLIPTRPNLTGLEIKGDAAVSRTSQGGDNYDASGTLNVPLSDTFALRATAYRYDTEGFVDDVYPGNPIFGAPTKIKKDVNNEETNGGRLMMLYQPTAEFTAMLTALSQVSETDGVPESQPSLGEFKQARGGNEGLDDDFKLVNLNLSYDFGVAELTSVSSFVRREDGQARSVEAFTNIPVTLKNSNTTDFLVQELRVAASSGPLFWIAGAYFSKKDWEPMQRTAWFGSENGLRVVEGAFGAPPNSVSGENIYVLDAELSEQQIAVFGDGTYSLTDDLSVAVGLRWFEYEQDRHEVVDGLFNGFAHTDQSSSTKEDQFTPRLNISYKATSDLLLYTQAAKGFRVGRVNLSAPLSTCGDELASYGLSQVPMRSDSDSLWSYEAGTKISTSDRRAQVNLSAFYIDWSDIQTNALLQCGFTFYANAGKASNRGVELELSGKVADSLTLSLTGSYNDAKLEEDAPLFSGSQGRKGDRIPGVPEYNAQVSAQFEQPIGDSTLSVRGDYTYVSDYYGNFQQLATRRAGDYGVVNLRVGLQFGSMAVELFADNLTDEQVILLSDPETGADPSKIFGRPRTVGIRLRAWN
ncbi:MAG TPA: TonB-dependent receptor [Steroidobacter sp.]